ncbi:hypothetical protein GCM10022255_035870 [Dactylosporangium darangshiense]|uniref:Uncharacterized protein n=1 Tax=Dactylosporangium darangshiense TaxID=579108 RepID=A0ABP8D906_9ACTN
MAPPDPHREGLQDGVRGALRLVRVEPAPARDDAGEGVVVHARPQGFSAVISGLFHRTPGHCPHQSSPARHREPPDG